MSIPPLDITAISYYAPRSRDRKRSWKRIATSNCKYSEVNVRPDATCARSQNLIVQNLHSANYLLQSLPHIRRCRSAASFVASFFVRTRRLYRLSLSFSVIRWMPIDLCYTPGGPWVSDPIISYSTNCRVSPTYLSRASSSLSVNPCDFV